MVMQHYRWDFIGLSTDTKPTPETSEKVVDGSTYYCSDTSKLYVYCKDNWYEKVVEGGGGTSDFDELSNRPKYNGTAMTGETNIPEVKSLTAGDGINITNDIISATNTGKARSLSTADYNANSSNWSDTDPANFNCIALWKLESGVYYKLEDVVAYGTTSYQIETPPSLILIGKSSAYATIIVFNVQATGNVGRNSVCKTDVPTGAGTISNLTAFLTKKEVQDNLTSTQTQYALSANQGKVLKGLIDAISQSGAGAPATSTVGTVGQLYQDTTNGKLYICTDATNPYVWEEVGAGGSITPVQTTGTSTTDVMSQKATTDMVFSPTQPDSIVISKSLISNQREQVIIGESTSSTHAGTGSANIVIGAYAKGTSGGYNYSISIGKNAEVSQSAYGIAIGFDSYVKNGISGVAIGGGSYASQRGQFDISASRGNPAGSGYNNSNYRLLTGLYDGQSNHDAATYGQLKNAIINGGTTAPTTTTVGAVGTQYTYVDTTGTPTAHLCVCTAIDNTDPDNPVYTWQTLI